MNIKYIRIILTIVTFFFVAAYAAAHCEIPCGIYDDEARISMIAEHITTIEKSMQGVIELQKEKVLNYNQITRWIMNKEEHATKIQEIVSQYFMTQRIKPEATDYEKKLVLLHKMLMEAMKCKQTIDFNHTNALRDLLKAFSDIYLGSAKH